jgi:hypothetical protein
VIPGLTPAAVRAMTPEETDMLVRGWNDAQRAASGKVEAPSRAEVDELIARYG